MRQTSICGIALENEYLLERRMLVFFFLIIIQMFIALYMHQDEKSATEKKTMV